MPNLCGLEERHWKELNKRAIWPLQRAGCTVSVFGSRARGDHALFSDLDLLIEGPVSRSQIAHIAEELEESTLPIRVDIVLYHELAESYREGVLRDRVELPVGIGKEGGC